MVRFPKTILVFLGLALLSARADTVLVLPFFNLSNSTNLDWIGESIAETVRESLTAHDVLALDREERLEAFPRLSIRPYPLLTRASASQLAASLDSGPVVLRQDSVTPRTDPSESSLRLA